MKWAYGLLAAALAAVLSAATLIQPVSVPVSPGQNFVIPPAAANAACPGPQQIPVGDAGASGDLAAGTDDKVLTQWGDGAEVPVGLGAAWPATLAASLEVVGDGDLMGLAGTSCSTAGFDEWLVGGATTLGSSSRLVLTNPAGASSQATVTIFGPLGQVGEPVVIAVPARSQVDRLLEGIAAELPTLAVHVVSSGPGLVAHLQDSRLDGFQPAGTDWVSATVPLTRQVVPSVGSANEGSTATLRLLAPEGAAVSVTLVTAEGIDAWSGARRLDLDPGVVTDIRVPVTELGALEITSDLPVLASARTVVQRQPDEGLEGDLAYDHQWVAGIDESESTSLSAIIPRELSTIVLYAPVGGAVEFVDPSGSVIASVQVTARTVQRIDIEASAGTLLTATGRVAWTVEVSNEEGTFITALMPVDTARADREVTLRLVPYAPVITGG